ncbi:UDP-N-acetylmuramyl pentapeptide phosphotransferase/UDP-N-acetylglucosamine-1-phosphate transferase [Geoglobus ahangari]|uniref:UDP-N-acetylmuramyl pentapeptide phosphotransferase/UDP-N-acetylglucosamine-1-phosphate transferase n=1 Tax=Geoglobus ahangari TaxID=113653 RepID=A0A0F7DC93_9EURY|nr:hypothetical protein [Geoglobus ahangari]AKG92441.1 UDP-N-acetylmuramyl pentapeptide phosphotransferase/UDP-N-acetylglucosamine-1-phosphate transferase [Geoglobus ahangari]
MWGENSEWIIVMLTAFAVGASILPLQIKKFVEKGVVVPDYYKNHIRYVPTSGGLSVLLAFYTPLFLALTGIFPLNVSLPEVTAAFIIALYGLFGLLDDLIDVGRISKVILPPMFAIPIAFVAEEGWAPVVGSIDGALLFVVAPVYVMVVANLINMHSGFNGMASGLTSLLLGTLLVKTLLTGKGSILVTSAMLGALIAFLYYNWYPSRIFDGNIGAFTMGSVVGLGIVLGGFYVSGFIMLIPHTVNFLMYVYWRIMRFLRPHDKRYELVKFGRVRKDKTIEAPNPYTLKWVLPYYFRVTERQIVLAMYALTGFFCAVSLFIPY